MAVNFEDEGCGLIPLNLKGEIYRWQFTTCEYHIHHRTPDGMHDAAGLSCFGQELFGITHAFRALRANGVVCVMQRSYSLTRERTLI